MFTTKIAMIVQLFTDNNLWLEVSGSGTSSGNLAVSYSHLSYGVALWPQTKVFFRNFKPKKIAINTISKL